MTMLQQIGNLNRERNYKNSTVEKYNKLNEQESVNLNICQ